MTSSFGRSDDDGSKEDASYEDDDDDDDDDWQTAEVTLFGKFTFLNQKRKNCPKNCPDHQKSRSPIEPYELSPDHARPLIFAEIAEKSTMSSITQWLKRPLVHDTCLVSVYLRERQRHILEKQGVQGYQM